MKRLGMIFAAVLFLAEIAAAFTNGQDASGLIGQAGYSASGENHIDSCGIYGPNAIAVDPTTGEVYVSDSYNNRVLRFPSTASLITGSGATGVLGQPDFYTRTTALDTPTASSLWYPSGVAVDAAGNLYVSDMYRNRVLKFADATRKPNGAAADVVLGQPDFTSKKDTTSQRGMSCPGGLAVDGAGNLYVADVYNNRVLKFTSAATKYNGDPANVVLGQPHFLSNAQGTGTRGGMYFPVSVCVDGSGNLFVADNCNNRVLKFAGAASKVTGDSADGVLGQPDFASYLGAATRNGMGNPNGVAVDGAGNLYVADGPHCRILKYSSAAAKANGDSADAVLGQPDFTSSQYATSQNGMWGPYGVAADAAGNLFVGDFNNNRVLKFLSAASKGNGADADIVLGQLSYAGWGPDGTDSLGLSVPQAVAVDPVTGDVWVADAQNYRVLRFTGSGYRSGQDAVEVLGQPDFYSRLMPSPPTAASLYEPWGVAIDRAGNLYVADHYNNRILKFADAAHKSNGANANAVLGQPGFATANPTTTQNGLNYPGNITLDSLGDLYVADFGNHRVLIYLGVASKANGGPADIVLGQPDFTSSSAAATAAGMSYPSGVAVDAQRNLYVAEGYNNRVMKFSQATSKANGDPAEVVLGQPDFLSHGSGAARNRMNGPYSVALDGQGNLYVAEGINNRVTIFNNAASKATNDSADLVLGQKDFTTSQGGTSQNRMANPLGVAYDKAAGKLYVADAGNNRVLVFDASGPVDAQGRTPLAPGALALSNNYPNPFNLATMIEYSLGSCGRVSLKVYDIRGREMATLADGEQKAGTVHRVSFDASALPAGLYFYKLEAGNRSLVKSLMVLK